MSTTKLRVLKFRILKSCVAKVSFLIVALVFGISRLVVLISMASVRVCAIFRIWWSDSPRSYDVKLSIEMTGWLLGLTLWGF